MTDLIWFITLTAGAFVLLALEVFVPGGILGILGGASLIGACYYAFAAFGSSTGGLVSVLLVLVTTGAVFAWIIHLPRSRMGKRIALGSNLKTSKSTEERPELVGKTGVAETDLRPSGYARIDGAKIDVVAERGFIEHGTPLVVTEVHGMRIVVSPASTDSAEPA